MLNTCRTKAWAAVFSLLAETTQIPYCTFGCAHAGTLITFKPHPEIFLTAAEHLGVAPADCLGVEDAAAGVAAIKDAGMFAVGVGSPDVLHRADRVIPSMEAFRLQDY